MHDNKSISIGIYEEVLIAEKRIRKYIRKTYLEHSPFLSQMTDSRVYLKLECLQITGSFKYRGALNKFLSLTAEQRKGRLITASTGNHGAAFAHVIQQFGSKGMVYLPENASPAKVNMLRQYGVELEFKGQDCIVSETLARQSASNMERVFIPPYNDEQIIAGQGTIGLELLSQLEPIDAVLVPVGGGGLISGIAGCLKAVDSTIEIIGCQPLNSAVMAESIKAGKIVEIESKPTIADGTAGGIEPESVTFDICREAVDDFILVSENEIKEAIRLIIQQHQMLIEGAAALSVACFLKEASRFKDRNVVVIISGKKISPERIREILNESI